MNLLTPMQESRIINNVIKACKNINELNSQGYKFIYLASGFIAHYNLEGFKSYYSKNSLKNAILENARFNQWNNFTSLNKDFDYYMQKKKIYNSIIEKLNK